jgi:CcmD family protein
MNHFGSVVAAYMVIWGFLMLYQFTISRRVSSLSRQVDRLKETIEGSGR